MPLTLDGWLFHAWQRRVGAALNDAKRGVELVVLALDPCVVVDADADAEQSTSWVEVVEKFVVVVMFREL